MNAYEPLRRRGYFLSDSGNEPGTSENESAEGISYNRAVRPRRSRKVAPGSTRATTSPRHRTHSSQHRSGGSVRSTIATGIHRP